MRFECAACQRLVELRSFSVDGEALVLTCAACGMPSRFAPVRAPAPAPPSDLFAVPEGHCSKCLARTVAEASACPGCGLSYASGAPRVEVPAPLEEAYRALAARWDDDAAHERFVDFAFRTGLLAEAGRLYRLKGAQEKSDGRAKQGIEAIHARAAQIIVPAMLGQPEERRAAERPASYTWLVIAGAGFIAVLLALYLQRLG